ncbi:MAG: hypothetical protein P8J65_01750 [Candidatus Actinomarina sp.]|nr:hypothetical protein [Candidatus Actinomarina sp.]MDG2082494.1 hypothetical protein [Candidatus Actinomarina sp.]
MREVLKGTLIAIGGSFIFGVVVGGSIPFANDFVEKFPNAELVLVGAGDEEMGNAHAPNESVQIEDIENLIKSLVKTLKDFS